MNTRQALQSESITACLAVVRGPDFRRPSINVLHAQLKKAAAEIHELHATQIAAGMESVSNTKGLAAARKNVRKQLFRITRHAEAVLDGVPGIREDVRVPHANAKDAVLIKAAARIIKNLRPHMKSLIATGLSKDEVPNLEVAIKRLKEKPGGSVGIARRSRATASMPDAVKKARKIAKALDAVIRAEFPPGAHLAAWNSVYRVPRKKGRPKKKRPPPPA